MKLIKYMLFIIVLVCSIYFIIKLDHLNKVDGESILIKFPYFSSLENFEQGVKVWEAMIITFSIGVFVGFIIALFQIVSQKSENISLKSKIRRLKNELDGLRNQSIDDDIDIEDEIDNGMNI